MEEGNVVLERTKAEKASKTGVEPHFVDLYGAIWYNMKRTENRGT